MNCDKNLRPASGNPLIRGRLRSLLPLLPLLLLVPGGLAAHADWPEFRGPWGNGYASAPGETKPVSLTLEQRSFQTFDTNTHKWTLQPGVYQILAGTSSRDLPLNASVTIAPAK